MKLAEELKSLVDQMPDPDDRGMYTKNIDKEQIEAAVAKIFEGGRDYLQGLIDMLGEPGSAENVKPHYALHCVLNHALIIGDDEARRVFGVTLASNLSADLSDYNKAYLCQELQWMGRSEAVEALGQLLLDEALTEPAAMALVAIKTGAAATFRQALPNAQGKCRLSIIDALVALEDPDALDELMAALEDEDPEVRIAARAGLAKLPVPAATRAVIQSVAGTTGWERTQAAKCLLVAAETVAAHGNTGGAKRIYDVVTTTFADPAEAHVREAAALGRASLTG